MIRKLRWKFIWIAEAAVFGLLALILISINIANFSIVANRADEITAKIASSGGKIDREDQPPFESQTNESASADPKENTDGIDKGPHGPFDPDTIHSIRYFTVKIESSGNAYPINFGFHIDAVSAEEAVAWATEIGNRETGWWHTVYRFRSYYLAEDPTSRYVSFIDQTRELSPSYNVLNASIVGSIVGVIISFVVLVIVSKWFVKPLEISDKKQKRFISDASHELKTPLTIISANAELLELKDGENEHTVAIKRQVERLTSMIRQMNTLAKLEEGDSESANVDLGFVAFEVFDSFKPSFENRNLSVTSSIPDKLIYKCNESNLRRLFTIVLENALKYAVSKVDFSIKEESSHINIICRNDAKLSQSETLEKVFERFYRSDEARAGSIEGSGIGLSVAKTIVDQMKGHIKAINDEGDFVIKIVL